MFGKELKDITFSDITFLVQEQNTPEDFNLDFKKELDKNADRAKRELSKDVSSFANGGGGYLILGVSEGKELLGIEPMVNGRSIVEWINQVVHSNLAPKVFYNTPKIVPIPNSEKVIVVIHIPESIDKPHMHNETHSYFIRNNDISAPADHFQVRNMFEYSRNRTNELEEFLNKMNIYNEDSETFCQNRHSQLLWNRYFRERPRPTILYSVIPKNIKSQKLNVPFGEFKEWLVKNQKGYTPDKDKYLFFTQGESETLIDGLVIKNKTNSYLKSYFKILNNGYLEAGLSESIFGADDDTAKNPRAHLLGILGYEMMLLGFIRNFYTYVDYIDEVQLQLNFNNVRLLGLDGLANGARMRSNDEAINRNYTNFKIISKITPEKTDDTFILSLLTEHSETICRAFDLDFNYGIRNGVFDKKTFLEFFQV